MADLQIKRPMAVGRRGKEGVGVWLLASRDDIDQGNTNGPAQVYDERSRTFTEPLPLQQWFKFVTFPGVEEGTPLPFDVDDKDAPAIDPLDDETAERVVVQMTGAVKGGPGSGYHDPHMGLPGVHGGSQPREGYVWEKIKHGKKPKPATGKPKTPKEPPKQYPPGTPDSISDAADDEDEASAPAKRGKPKGTPVSKAVRMEANGKVESAMRSALVAVDTVHGDGYLTDISFENSNHRNATSRMGFFERRGDFATRIVVADTAITPSLITLHEIGHWLDWSALEIALGKPIQGSSNGHEFHVAIGDFWDAIENTQNVKLLREIKRTKKVKSFELVSNDGAIATGDKHAETKADNEIVSYLLRREELWARAYAQYVAIKSDREDVKQELISRQQKMSHYPDQWSDEDFAPVADAIDNLFKTMGWIE
jgi:hypothetical protein